MRYITIDEALSLIPKLIAQQLGIYDPNYCPENDEQITLRMNPTYCWVLHYIFGLDHQGKGMQAAAYMEDMFSDRMAQSL